MLNVMVLKGLEEIVAQYFIANRYYDSVHFWCRKNKLVKLSNHFHEIAHKKLLNADFFLEYVLQNVNKEDKFEFYETPRCDTEYETLLSAVEYILSFEIETKKLLDDMIKLCSFPEINDQETIDLINRFYPTQRNYLDNSNLLKEVVLAYGNTPKDWVDISVRIDNIVSIDWGDGYGK